MDKEKPEIDQELCLKAHALCVVSYDKSLHINLGTTEMFLGEIEWKGEIRQALAVPGSNEGWDWVENFKVWSKKGYKIAGWDAAIDILVSKQFRKWRDYNKELITIYHSKSGPTGFCLKNYHNIGDYLIAFEPAPGMRRSLDEINGREMSNALITLDPDDPVTRAGRLSFGYPKCRKIIGKNDPELFKTKDHLLPHVKQMILNNMEPNHPEKA